MYLLLAFVLIRAAPVFQYAMAGPVVPVPSRFGILRKGIARAVARITNGPAHR